MRRLLLLATLVAALNVLWIALAGGYDLRLGPIHLAAHGLFKPLLYLCAALLLAALAGNTKEEPGRESWSPSGPWIAVAVVLIYLPSLSISATHNDWTHQADVLPRNTLASLAQLFVWKQPDGFYRPLVFLSLWVDARLFGDHQWGYHLQNILFHIANSLLLVRLGTRLGLKTAAVCWAALLFAVAAANYEPVIWPGARFDLMAACFTLAALIFGVWWLREGHSGALWGMSCSYVLAVLSKESAYCFPLLLALLVLTPGLWNLPAAGPARRVWPLGLAAVLSIVLLGIRWAVLNGVGGYPAEAGVEPHFTLRLATFTSFFTRALPVPLFGLNTSVRLAWWAQAAVVCFALGACGYAAYAGGPFKQKLALLAAALLGALPAMNLVDWISPAMHNTRYLYLPGMWICLLLAVAGSSARARLSLQLIVLANAIGAVYNYRVFVL